MNYRVILSVIIGVILLIALTIAMYQQSMSKKSAQSTVEQSTEPQKTDFGAKLPNDFPSDIPVETGAIVNQSYSLNYAGQNQLTIVFPSAKTVKENYVIYEGFLKNQQWNISNTYESENLSSLYGMKGDNEINVTISSDASTTSVKSQVSISVLKK